MLFYKGNCIEAVIFDIDGTIIDSLSFYHQYFNNGLQQLGLQTVSKDFLFRCLAMGMSLGSILRKIIPNENDQAIEKLAETILKTFMKVDMDVPLLPGVREVLSFLKRKEVKIGLATGRTSGVAYETERLKHLGLDGYVDVVVTAAEVQNRKPAPDVIIECARRLRVESKNCLVVGDSVSDVFAAKQAGAIAIAVCTGVDDYEKLIEAEPVAVIKNLSTMMELLVEI